MEKQIEYFGERITSFLPDLIGALLVLFVGWLIAKAIKHVVVKLMKKTHWDEKLFGRTDNDTNVFIANIFYYIIMVIVLLIVLEILGVNEVLTPLENMIDKFLSFIPNLIAAALIVFIGYLLAKFVSGLVNISGQFLDKWIDKTGFKETDKLINILRKVVFIIILVPFIIQAFNALQMEAISAPANDILYGFTEMIGQIIIAALVLAIFIWGGRYLTNFLEDLFRSMGMDKAAEKIQIHNMIGANQSLSKLIANLLYFFLVFFGIITAVEILGLERLTITLNEILEITGQILFGLIILAVGNYISLLIYNTMTQSNNNRFIAGIIRWASLALFIAIGLRTMGIANEIVELAFGLILGAIAVAVALAYGLGGRDAAGEHFKDIIQKFTKEASDASGDNSDKKDLPPNNPNRPLNPNDPDNDGKI